MCLISQDCEPRIAIKDIICYKVVGYFQKDLYISPFQGTPFSPNEYGVVELNDDGINIVYEGAHESEDMYEIGPGYTHTYKFKRDASYCSNPLYHRYSPYICPKYIIYECIIPKDTKYYEGVDGDGYRCYASKKIKIVKKL